MVGLRAQTFDGHDHFPGQALHRYQATACGGPVHVNRAGAAQSRAAAVLSPRQTQLVAQVPQQWHIWLAVEFTALAIHFQLDHSFSPGVWLSSMIHDFDILPPPNAKALWRGIPGLPPGRFSVLRKRILACSPKGLPVPSALFFSPHFYLDGSQARISSSDRFASPA